MKTEATAAIIRLDDARKARDAGTLDPAGYKALADAIDQQRLVRDEGLAFVVRRVEADYLRPGRFDDLLEVVTRPVGLDGPRMLLDQSVERDGTVLFTARVTLVCVDLSVMRPQRPPAATP